MGANPENINRKLYITFCQTVIEIYRKIVVVRKLDAEITNGCKAK